MRAESRTLSVRRSLASGYRLTVARLGGAVLLTVIVQGAVALVAVPLLGGLFSLAARAAGLASVTTADVAQFLSSPLGVGVAIVSLVLTVAALLAQTGIFLSVAWLRRSGTAPTAAAVFGQLRSRATALLRRADSLLMIPYLMLVVPLAHIGIGSVLTRGVAVPAFVTDELLKEPLHAALYTALMLLIWYLNLRLIFTLPVLLLTDAGAASAIARSWRLTRWRTVKIIGLLAGVIGPLLVGILATAAVALLPVVLSDALSPALSPVVASVAFALAQFFVFVLVGLFLLIQSHVLVEAGHECGGIVAPTAVPVRSRRSSRTTPLLAALGAAVVVVALSIHAYSHLNEVSDGATTVLAHRGYTAAGVENTIEALEGANAVDADVVEMDVQQTADGGWVLMHDLDLKRLADRDGSVAQLTAAEAVTVRVHDEDDRSGLIPSLEEYLQRADELDQQLLIEIKVHGDESADFVPQLIELIDRVDGADEHIYHTLSTDVVAAFKQLRPDLRIGLIVPIAYGGVPDDTPADFLVVEQGVYSRQLRDDVWSQGKSLFVWTVEDPDEMRELFRDNVDGIISDRPDLAADELLRISGEQTMASRMYDALRRLVAF